MERGTDLAAICC